MANLSIRNLDEAVVAALKQRAKDHRRSLEAEIREILAQAVQAPSPAVDLRALAEQIARLTPQVPQTDSAILVREDRDR